MVDALTDQLRSHNGHADAERAELWLSSVAAYNRRRQEEHRLAWAEFHTGQAERHRRALEELVKYHEQKAQELMTDEPEGAA